MSHLEFSELDRPLLERYCAITMLLRKTMRHIRAKGTKEDGRPNPWLKIHERQLSLLAFRVLSDSDTSHHSPVSETKDLRHRGFRFN